MPVSIHKYHLTNYVVLQLLVGTVMLVIGNLIGDILLKAVDPRIKLDDME